MNTNIPEELATYLESNSWERVAVYLWELEGYFQAQIIQCENILNRLDEADQCVSSPVLELMFFQQGEQEYYLQMRRAHYSEKPEEFEKIGRVDQDDIESNPIYIHHLTTLSKFINSDAYADGAARRQNAI
ncbi:MAG: hypothetical protein DSZ04_03005 [Sulfurimonas sp.]|nr:MAG: hypothetical protein DSZ04_03005 [Sulfurimonas sp.]